MGKTSLFVMDWRIAEMWQVSRLTVLHHVTIVLLLAVRQDDGVWLTCRPDRTTCNKFTYRHVLQWWVYCALVERCISPDGAQLMCDSQKLKETQYGGCHRFDQSALGILMTNRYQGHKKSYDLRDKKALDDTGEFLAVKRGDTGGKRPLFCGPSTSIM